MASEATAHLVQEVLDFGHRLGVTLSIEGGEHGVEHGQRAGLEAVSGSQLSDQLRAQLGVNGQGVSHARPLSIAFQ